MRRLSLILSSLLVPLALFATPTPVSVSVLSGDAKFVGSSMGGMQVTIRDSLTGELMASGKTLGSTGDTPLIMSETRGRDEVLRTEGSARFDTELDLHRVIYLGSSNSGASLRSDCVSKFFNLTLSSNRSVRRSNLGVTEPLARER